MAYTDIDKSDDYFNPVTWTGTGDPTTSVTGVNFQPDFVWIKNRSVADDHMLFDAVRGVTKRLFSNSTAAEGTDVQTLTSFDSDGFTTGNNRATGGDAGNGMVSWNWLGANGTASNTDGSITSTVSANTTSGFSIVSYTGTGSNATVGHGLGVTPKMMIVKQRTGTENWTVYHVSIGNPAQYMELNSTGAVLTNSLVWNSTNPTSSVFSVGTNARTNNNTSTYIAYCFAEKKGFSKFGSYVSNNNADGTFVYTGFKPAFLLLKNITTGSTGWEMYDNKRTPNNVANLFLRANTSGADVSSDRLDILSNGFKLRQVGDTNYNSDVIIYMAFAENPFVTSTGIPTTAR
jgi:hypothetical protein